MGSCSRDAVVARAGTLPTLSAARTSQPEGADSVATLDYALLAEYARVDPSGLLTVVGASFDRVQAQNEKAAHQVFVALRVLLDEAESSVDFEITVRPPSEVFSLALSGHSERNPDAIPVDGKVAVVVTAGMLVPLPEPGRYVVSVTLSDGQHRELPFIVEHVTPLSL